MLVFNSSSKIIVLSPPVHTTGKTGPTPTLALQDPGLGTVALQHAQERPPNAAALL